MSTTRERLHEMLDALPDELLADAEDAITALSEPPYRPLSEAPDDDEPVTDEDRDAIREGRAAYARGEFVTDDELKRRLGW
jgi:predicted transcriptional regulator